MSGELAEEFAVYNLPNGFLDAGAIDGAMELPEGVGSCCFVFARSVSDAVHKHVVQVAQDQDVGLSQVRFEESALA